jgi:Na+/melibiose symporter-like transporter
MAAMNLSLAVFLPQFYATETTIGLAAIGFAFMVVRLGDLAFDLALGIAIDRTATRIGRFRPWMLAGIPVVITGAWLAYSPPQGVGLAYLIGALTATFAGYSMVTVTQFSWAAVLAESSAERSRIYGWIQAASIVGMLMILGLLPLMSFYGIDQHAVAVRGMGTFIVISTPITVLIATIVSPEPRRAALRIVPSLGRSLLEYGIVLLRPDVMRVMLTTALLGLASGITSALFLFFAWAKGFSSAQSTIFLIIYFVGAFASTQLWAPLSKRATKSKVLAALCGYVVLIQLMALFLPYGAFAWACVGQLALGVSYSGNMVLLKSIVGDVAEAAKTELDEDFTGRLYALYVMITKASIAIAVGLMFVILQAIGYAPKAANGNTPDAIRNLVLCCILIPAVLTAAGGLVMLRTKSRPSNRTVSDPTAEVSPS